MYNFETEAPPEDRVTFALKLSRTYQMYLDKLIPYYIQRWVGFFLLVVAYVVRIAIIQGFHVVSYALGIFLLNQLIRFLSPKIDPELENDDLILPTSNVEGEFKPFIRKLPEFHFWHTCTLAFFISIICTYLPFLDLPVFWPILVMYFFILFYLTMKKQIEHMIRYKYLPFSYGKPKHNAKPAKNSFL